MKLSRGLTRSLLAGAGAALIVSSSVSSSFKLFEEWGETNLEFVGSDSVTKNDERFEPVKKVLPRQGVVGFVTDQPGAVDRYYQAQYSLVPLLLEPNKSHEYVVSLYSSAPSGAGRGATGLHSVKDLGYGMKLLDFGNGIRVYHNEHK